MSRRAKVGALVVDVLANVGGFRRGVSGSKKDVKGLDSEVGRLNKTLSRLRLAGEAFVALKIGAGVINNLRATGDEMARTAKISRKLGAATEELISMRHAASQLTEVAASGLDMAMQRWTRRLAEAAAGTGEAQKAIAELNLDAKRLQGLTLTQQMLEIAGAMQKVEKQSDKLRIAFKFFDSEGAALVNLFNSPGELQKKLGEASSLGLTFSESDAKKLEQFNDAVDKLGKSLSGVKQGIVIDVAPAALEIVEGLRVFQRDMQNFNPTSAGGKALNSLRPRHAFGLVGALSYGSYDSAYQWMFGSGSAGEGGFTAADGFSAKELSRLRGAQAARAPERLTLQQRNRREQNERFEQQRSKAAQRGLQLEGKNNVAAVRYLGGRIGSAIGDAIETTLPKVKGGVQQYLAAQDRITDALRERDRVNGQILKENTAKENDIRTRANRPDNTAVDSRSVEGFRLLRENLKSGRTEQLAHEQLEEAARQTGFLETIADAISGPGEEI